MSAMRPVFLERRRYRRRRMMDAVRLLPFLALAAWMIPLLWGLPEGTTEVARVQSMSSALTYVFGIWVLVVLAGFALWALTGRSANQDADDEPH